MQGQAQTEAAVAAVAAAAVEAAGELAVVPTTVLGTALNIGGDTALNIGGDATTTRLMDPEREQGDDSVDATTRLMDTEDDSMDGPGRRLDEYDLEILDAEDDAMDTTTRYWRTREHRATTGFTVAAPQPRRNHAE